MPRNPFSSAADSTPGLFSRDFLWATLGTVSLCFLAAFESLAVTTIMPVVSAELHGASLYALAFSGPLATGIIGMVAGGNWADRVGPTLPLYTSVAAFIVGLLIAGTATSMVALVAGRLVQGFGAGAMIVALYVVVARAFPARLHPSIFAGFAAAWVIPSLIGPVAAGAVTEIWSWHWVFLGVVALVVFAMAMVVPAMHSLSGPARFGEADAVGEPAVAPWSVGRILWAVVAAVAVLGLSLLSTLPAVGGLLAGIAVAVAIIAVRPLVPRGTLTARRGLPSVILTRGVIAASFFGAEVYLPYLLIDHYDFSATLAGLALTLAALAWASASWLQGRLAGRLTHVGSMRIGSSIVVTAIAFTFATALWGLPAIVAIIGWGVGGAGMGLMYPRTSVMTLALSTSENQGFNSSALSISDSLGASLALATTGIIFVQFSFAGVFALAGVIAVFAVALSPRVSPDRPAEAHVAGSTQPGVAGA
ncbi:MAG: MFS transporter [Terrimesophilobacter sp.]